MLETPPKKIQKVSPRLWQLNIFFFQPWGFMIQFDAHIFQMGGFNHQLVNEWFTWK